MESASLRFARWFAWLGESQSEVARRLGCVQSMVSGILAEKRRPGLDLAFVIERQTAARHPVTGESWDDGPIEAQEWRRNRDDQPTTEQQSA